MRAIAVVAAMLALALSPPVRAACEHAPPGLPFGAADVDAFFDADGALVVRDGVREFALAGIAPPSDRVPEDDPCVLSVQQRADAYFIVAVVHRWSNGRALERGSCAAGIESEVVWVRMTAGKAKAQRHALFESCHHSREGGFAWDGDTLRVETQAVIESDTVEDALRWHDIVWTFDAKQPQHGLVEHVGEARP